MHEVACLRFKGSSSEEYLTFTHHHGKISLFLLPYSPRTYSSSVYRVYLPFYRVKNPISPSLPMVLGLSHHTPLHHSIAFTKEVPLFHEHWCGRSDPSNPSEFRRYRQHRIFLYFNYVIVYFLFYFQISLVCFLTRGFVRPQ